MKAIVKRLKREVSLLLAAMMVLTSFPQAVANVYGADFDTSEDVIIDDFDSALDALPTKPTVTFITEYGKMPSNEKAVAAVPADGDEKTSQTFYYKKIEETGKYVVSINSIADITPIREGYTFSGWYDASNTALPESFTDSEAYTRVYTAKWVRLTMTPAIDTTYGENGFVFDSLDGKVYSTFKIKKEKYEGIRVESDEALVAYYSYGEGWNSFVINQTEDSYIKCMLFDQPTIDKEIKLQLRFVLLNKTLNPDCKVNDSLSNTTDYSELAEYSATYLHNAGVYVYFGANNNTNVLSEIRQKNAGGNYDLVSPAEGSTDSFLYLQKGRDTAISQFTNEISGVASKGVITNISFRKHGSSDEFKTAEKTELSFSGKEKGKYYIISANALSNDTDVKLDIRDLYTVKGIKFEEASTDYNVYYRLNNNSATEWIPVSGKYLNEIKYTDETGTHTRSVRESDELYVKIESVDGKAISRVSTSNGITKYLGKANGYYLKLSDIETNNIDVTVTPEFSDYSEEAVNVLYNNTRLTEYGGKGIKVELYRYSRSENKDTLVKANKTTADGSCEYVLPLISDGYYHAIISSKDNNSCPVYAVLRGVSENKIRATGNKISTTLSDVDCSEPGKYVFDVEAVSKKWSPVLKTADGRELSYTTSNGKIIYNVPRNTALVLSENNIDGRESYLRMANVKYPDKTETVRIESADNRSISIAAFDGRYAGQQIEFSLYSDISGENGNKIYLNVAQKISKITFKDVKTVKVNKTQYQALTQEIGTEKEYPYTLDSSEKTSADELKAVIFENESAAHNYASASGENDWAKVEILAGNKLYVKTKLHSAKNKASYVVIFDKETHNRVAAFYIDTVNPAFLGTAPSAALNSARDVSVNLKLTLPKNATVSEGLYYKIKLENNKNTKLVDNIAAINNTVYYVPANSGATNSWVYTFKDNSNAIITTLGMGHSVKMNANVSMVLTDGTNPDGLAENSEKILAKSPVKTFAVATKEPYYAEKISIKKAASAAKLYAGQNQVKIADVNLGSNTTYNTTEYWKVTDVVDADDISVTDKITPLTAVADISDTGIYLNIASSVKAGKYKVKVCPVRSGEVQAPETTFDIKVLPTIKELGVTLNGTDITTDALKPTYRVYKKPNGKATLKATLSAKDQDEKAIKSPKVTYTVGKVSGETIVPVAGLTVKNGTITVDKQFVKEDGAVYKLIVTANDYAGNTVKTAAYIDVDSEAVNVKTLELYTKNGANYSAITKNTTVKQDEQIYIAIKNAAGNDLVGSSSEPVAIESISTNGKIRIDLVAFEKAKKKLTKPGKVSVTATAIDGTKAKAEIPYTYASDNLACNNIAVDGVTYENGAEKNFTGNPASQKYEVKISGYEDGKLIEGSLKVDGAKIVKKNSTSQYMQIQMTKAEATITLTKKDASGTNVTKKVKLKNDALNYSAAPAASSVAVSVNGADKTDKLYAGYNYTASDYIKISLKDVIRDSSKNEVAEGSIKVSIEDPTGKFDVDNAVYATETVKDKKVAYVKLPLKVATRFDSSKFALVVNYKDSASGNYITKTPTTVNVSPAKFSKSFTVTSTQKMSLKDAHVINLTYKSKGVKNATLTGLGNFNSKGKYNEFTDTFGVNDAGMFYIKDNARTTNKANNVGYVKFHVVYLNGDTADYVSKISVSLSTK